MARLSFSPRFSSLLLLCGAFACQAQPSPAQTVGTASLRVAPEAQTIHASNTLQSAQAPGAVLSVDSGGFLNRLKSDAATAPPKSYTAFPSANVGTTSSSSITFTTSFSASTTVTGDGVYTLGASDSDFKNVGTGTCDTNGFPYTYAASTSCTTVVSFTPSRAGNREGAEVLYTSTAGSYYYGYLNGIGNGPQVTFSPGTPSTLTTGVAAYGTAIDGSGDLWVTDSAAGVVKEYIPNGGVYPSTPTNTYTGFISPQGIAIDGIGNVYVGDGAKGYLWRLSATNGVVPPGTAPVAYVTFLTAGTQPIFVALDPTQTYLWFIGIYSSSKYLVYCTISSGSCALGTTFTAPSGLAFDSAGYKYVTDSSAKTVTRMPVGTSVTKTTLLSGLTAPTGLAADAAGDLYLVDQGAGTSGAGVVTEYVAASGLVSSTSATRTLATGLYAPTGVAVDSSGNLFIADNSNNAVKQVGLTTPPTFTFANTPVGSISATQSTTLQNIGNTALTFTVPSSGTNPSVTSQFSFDASSNCPTSLAGGSAASLPYGSTCVLAVDYSPTSAGAYTGALTLVDNNLNVTNATQSIRMTGNTSSSLLTLEVIGITAPQGSTAVQLQYTLGYGGGTAPTAFPTITVRGSTSGVSSFACTGKLGHYNCFGSYNASSLTPGNYTITATEAANGTYNATSATGILSIIGSSVRAPSFPNVTAPQPVVNRSVGLTSAGRL